MLKAAKQITEFEIQLGSSKIVASGFPAVSLNLIKVSFWISCFLFLMAKTNIYIAAAIWISWKKINTLEQCLELKNTDSLKLKKKDYFEEPAKENKPSIEKSIRSLIETKKNKTKRRA